MSYSLILSPINSETTIFIKHAQNITTYTHRLEYLDENEEVVIIPYNNYFSIKIKEEE